MAGGDKSLNFLTHDSNFLWPSLACNHKHTPVMPIQPAVCDKSCLKFTGNKIMINEK